MKQTFRPRGALREVQKTESVTAGGRAAVEARVDEKVTNCSRDLNHAKNREGPQAGRWPNPPEEDPLGCILLSVLFFCAVA
eukprot:3033676-Heterocapsa_arctica.AAC.1